MRRLKLNHILLLLAVICGALALGHPTCAQLPSFKFEVITSREGLPTNSVLTAQRDKTGFMWFGTRVCPIRYDGATFQTFRVPETHLVTSLAVDKDNNIWFGSDQSGVCRIDGKLLHLDSIPHSKSRPQSGDFFIDSKGRGWYSDLFSAKQIDLKTQAIRTYPFKQTNFVWIKASFAEDSNHDIWVIGRDNGLFKYDAGKDSMTCVWGVDATDPKRRELVVLNRGYGDNEGYLWLATYNRGLIRYNTRNDSITYYETERVTNEVRAIEEGVDEFGKRIIWIGDDRGLGIFRPDQNKFYYFNDIMKEPYEVHDIYRDPVEGVVWVCTSKGIIKYHPAGNIFQTRLFPLAETERPAEVNYILQDDRPGQDQIFYLGLSHTGMIRWDHTTDQYKLIKYPAPIADTRWMSQRKDGTIWIGTNREDYERPGIFVFDPATNKFITTPLSAAANTYYSVPYFMYGNFDNQDRLWIGNSDEGIRVLDGKTGKDLTPWSMTTQQALIQNNNLINSLMHDRANHTWIGTYNGIKYADANKKTFVALDSLLPDSVKDWAVNSLLEDSKGNIWAARWGGLTEMSKEGRLLSSYTAATEFYDRENRGLAEDHDGNVWVGNFEGLYRVDPKTKKIFRFTMNDGLLSNNTTGRIFTDRSKEELLIGYSNGINFVRAAKLLEAQGKAPLVVASFKVHDKERRPDFKAPIKLQREDNEFSVDYIALNYRKHQDNQYAYYLEGFEKEWHYSGSDHVASYTNLNPGSYTLHLKAGDIFGNWNYGEMEIPVTVLPAFYETWWFRTLMVMIIGSMLYGLYRYRINQILRLHQIRNRISADLHDELGSSLSSISIIGTMAQQNLVGQHPSRPLLERMVEEIQQISTSLDDIVWNISPKNDALSNLIARMTRYASELFEAKQINFKLNMPEHLHQIKLSMEQRRNFYLVFKETVNNLVKYSHCSEAVISISIEQRSLILKISDNGKGFDPQALTDRNGLSNLRNRAEILNGRINITSAPGKGTIVELKFPLKFTDPKGLLTISGE